MNLLSRQYLMRCMQSKMLYVEKLYQGLPLAVISSYVSKCTAANNLNLLSGAEITPTCKILDSSSTE